LSHSCLGPGNAIHRQTQLSLAASDTRLVPADSKDDILLATGGLFAPTIRHRNGIVYVVCTNIVRSPDDLPNKSQNFIVSTGDIWSNEWSDPVYFEFRGIDPSIFFDDNGLTYMNGSATPGPMTKIHLFQIDLQTGEKLSEEKEIWGGTGGVYPEGPHLYKKDAWYYLMISEGGTHDGHMITVARSKDIWGPYESFDRNPILTAYGTDEYIRYTGHGDVFQDQQGRWWCVCLGVRKDDGRYVMGRETFLTTAEWSEGDWPSLNQVKLNPILPDGNEVVRTEGQIPLTAVPMVDYLYIRDTILSNHKMSNDCKTIMLTASLGSISQLKEPVTFVGKRQRRLEGTTTVLMHNPSVPSNTNLKAGLAYYKDELRYIKLFYDFSESAMVFEVCNKPKEISRISRQEVHLQDVVALRIQYTKHSYQFSYRDGAELTQWKSFDPVDTIDMTNPDFVGPVIGIFAAAEAQDVQVQFDNLEIE
jgi:beta-xylosidase